ncbi:MAG: HAD family hydrolase [Planctomycetota bacterium]|nr:HAD family hydrolase [Planctomycetota bacterium]
MKRFALLDRDGTIMVDRHYLADPEGVELLPGALAGLRRLRALGLGLAIITNQSGIARGLMTTAQAQSVNHRLQEILAAGGVTLDGIYLCPHAPEDHCACRKPAVGLAMQAAAALGFDPKDCFVIGDKNSDIGLARNLGAVGILVRTGEGCATEKAGVCKPDAVVDDLAAAAAWISRLVARR